MVSTVPTTRDISITDPADVAARMPWWQAEGYEQNGAPFQNDKGEWFLPIINRQPDAPAPLQLVKDGIFVLGDHKGDIVIRFNCQHEKFVFAKGLTLGAILLTLSDLGEPVQ